MPGAEGGKAGKVGGDVSEQVTISSPTARRATEQYDRTWNNCVLTDPTVDGSELRGPYIRILLDSFERLPQPLHIDTVEDSTHRCLCCNSPSHYAAVNDALPKEDLVGIPAQCFPAHTCTRSSDMRANTAPQGCTLA